ncbi:hypothetical protein QCA50_000637 [Cerrena zonata]|uniref:Uncharacterized protein n=1 Tax=Cerrena zonata TaxID=2478898 RepID=A0AAW0GZD1_9APHY
MMTTSVHKRSLAECDTILCAPGMPHEVECRLVEGYMQKVYKNLWPSLRNFWLEAATQYAERTYVVYEDKRLSYENLLRQSLSAAAVFKDVYNIRKGDRVSICSRNLPEYLIAFWACHLLGAVSVLVNAWLPSEPLLHCLIHTGGKLIILDTERADRILPAVTNLQTNGVAGFLVLDSPVLHDRWKTYYQLWEDVLSRYEGNGSDHILADDPHITPEDNATIIFTSGTTGLPKGVLSTQRQFLTNIRNATVGSSRAVLRRGDDLPVPSLSEPQKGLLISVPFFHVTGSTSLSMLATVSGQKIVLMRRWNVTEGKLVTAIEWTHLKIFRLILHENIRVAGGVPAMVSDLIESDLSGYGLETLIFGGSPAHDQLPAKGKRAFPNAVMSQAYGMTESNSIAVALAGIDYEERPTAAGLPCPVNDMLVVSDGRVVPAGVSGEVWLRGPNVMKCYWNDPVATVRTLTSDRWLRTGDLGFIDTEGFLYIRDRIKDLIIRGGENIDSVSVENVILSDPRIREVAAVGVPDQRLGELVAVVVSPKEEYRGQVEESQIIALARQRLPKFAVPVMVIVQDTSFELTPSGKIKKGPLREFARTEWIRRSAMGPHDGSHL